VRVHGPLYREHGYSIVFTLWKGCSSYRNSRKSSEELTARRRKRKFWKPMTCFFLCVTEASTSPDVTSPAPPHWQTCEIRHGLLLFPLRYSQIQIRHGTTAVAESPPPPHPPPTVAGSSPKRRLPHSSVHLHLPASSTTRPMGFLGSFILVQNSLPRAKPYTCHSFAVSPSFDSRHRGSLSAEFFLPSALY
jgi:hypothetical protein